MHVERIYKLTLDEKEADRLKQIIDNFKEKFTETLYPNCYKVGNEILQKIGEIL